MAAKSVLIPHPFVQGLGSERARVELYRNFASIKAAVGGGVATFTTVADDGTGDYLTPRAAVEAVPDDGKAFIYVKPPTLTAFYDDTAGGDIILAKRTNIVLWSATSFTARRGWRTSGTKASKPPQIGWKIQAFTTSNTVLSDVQTFTMHGFDVTHAGGYCVGTVASTIHYYASTCSITTTYLHAEPAGLATNNNRLFLFADCDVSKLATDGNNFPWLYADRTSFYTVGQQGVGSSRYDQSPTMQVFESCTLTCASNAEWVSQYPGTSGVEFRNCIFDQDSGAVTFTGASLAMRGCRYQDDEKGLASITVRHSNNIGPNRRADLILEDNVLPRTDIVVTDVSAVWGRWLWGGHITGAYRTINLDASFFLLDVSLDPETTNNLTLLTISKDRNAGFVNLKAGRTSGTTTGTIGVYCSGSNNVLYGQNSGFTVTDVGVGNSLFPTASGAGVPTGGSTGQVLAKNSAADLDVGWNSSGMPTGGSTGQVLAKNSAADFDAGWVAAGGGGGDDDLPWLLMGG